mmetsp:Transcript_35874/g.95077  ORF Transcript_35874/g.95077 Transcript_35874/m.95077 type:complete len:194 (-) Transcript_35874:307-888(-)
MKATSIVPVQDDAQQASEGGNISQVPSESPVRQNSVGRMFGRAMRSKHSDRSVRSQNSQTGRMMGAIAFARDVTRRLKNVPANCRRSLSSSSSRSTTVTSNLSIRSLWSESSSGCVRQGAEDEPNMYRKTSLSSDWDKDSEIDLLEAWNKNCGGAKNQALLALSRSSSERRASKSSAVPKRSAARNMTNTRTS